MISELHDTSRANTEPVRSDNSPLTGGQFRALLLAALLGLVTFALYWPAVHYHYINYDDEDYVVNNRHVETGLTLKNVLWAFTTGHSANWHPFTWLSLMLDISLFGKTAAGAHFTNIVLHATNVVLLFWLLKTLTGAIWRSAAVAALFGWHPLHVESVVWVAERKDVLSTFFGFLTLLFYVRYAQGKTSLGSRPQGAENGPPKSHSVFHSSFFILHSSFSYWLALGCFAGGLMSKAMLVTWPFVLLLLDYWPLRRLNLRDAWKLIGEKLPFFVLAAAASVVTFLAQRNGGAVVASESLPLGERCANALVCYCGYLGKMFWPADLAIFYPHPGNWPLVQVVLAAVFLGGVSGLLLVYSRRFPYLLTGWLWYGGTLVPVIGLIQVGRQSMADRYSYVPSVGISIMIVWGACALARRWHHRAVALGVASIVASALCVALTRHEMGYWRDSEGLFRRELAVTENNFVGHLGLAMALESQGRMDAAISEYEATALLQPTAANVRLNLGNVLLEKGRLEEAAIQFREAIRLAPAFDLAHENLAGVLLKQGHVEAALKEYQEGFRLHNEDDAPLAHYNLGVGLNAAGQTNAAIGEFETAIALQSDYAAARKNLATLFGETGQTDAETAQLQELLRITPDDADSHYNLGMLYLNHGQPTAAIKELQADLRIKSDDADGHYNLGQALLKNDQAARALTEFETAFRFKKYGAEIHYNLGNALAGKGQADAAIKEYEETIRLQPGDVNARNNLGNLLARVGQVDAAIGQLREALRLKPTDADAHFNLGGIYLKAGRTGEAISEFQESIRLKPAYAPAHYNLGVIFKKNGETDDAISQFVEAVRLDPAYAIAHNSLGAALAGQGRIDDAISQFQEALRIKPNYASAQNNLASAMVLKNQSPAPTTQAVKP